MWALIALKSMEILDPNRPNDDMNKTIVIQAGQIANVIAYDGSSPYVPESNFDLVEVADNSQIGKLASPVLE